MLDPESFQIKLSTLLNDLAIVDVDWWTLNTFLADLVNLSEKIASVVYVLLEL